MQTDEKQIQALITAIIEDNPTKVQHLLEQGVDPNACLDEDKVTPLHFAAQYNALRSTPYLLTAGANVYAMTGDYTTPHDIARLHKHTDMLKLLQSNRCIGSSAKN